MYRLGDEVSFGCILDVFEIPLTQSYFTTILETDKNDRNVKGLVPPYSLTYISYELR